MRAILSAILLLACSFGWAATAERVKGNEQTSQQANQDDKRYQKAMLVSIEQSKGTKGSAADIHQYDIFYITVKLADMHYVGEYSPITYWSARPSEFIVGDPVQVRIKGNHFWLKRPNGQEMKVRIVKRERA